jgi:hypothetical protein
LELRPKALLALTWLQAEMTLALLCHTQYAEQAIFAHSLLAKNPQPQKVKPILKIYLPLDQLRQQA